MAHGRRGQLSGIRFGPRGSFMRRLCKLATSVAICCAPQLSARAENGVAPAIGNSGYQGRGLVLASPRDDAGHARIRMASLIDRAAPEAARPIARAPEQPRSLAPPSSQPDRAAQTNFDGEWRVTSNTVQSGRCRAAD